jgi:hypothetical protein
VGAEQIHKWLPGGSMGSKPQKTQVLQKLFYYDRFCRAFLAAVFGKKFSSIGQFFFML